MVVAFFAAGGQTNGFSQFKVDSVCLPTFPHCGSFSIAPHRPLPHAKLNGTKPEIGTCRGNKKATAIFNFLDYR